MAQQGKAYTEKEKLGIIESLKPFLEMGYSRKKACSFIGFDDTTLGKWLKADAGLSSKVVAWENTNNALALANVYKALLKEAEADDGKVDNSWRYLERREESFKPKSDITSDDKQLPTPLLANVQTDHSSIEDTEPQEKD